MRTDSKLANAHWEYIRNLLMQHCTDTDLINIIGFHYTTAFVHGYKHGQEQLIEDYKTKIFKSHPKGE